MRILRGLLFLIVLSLISVMAGGPSAKVHAQIPGIVCIADPTSTSCPSSPIIISGTVGSQIVVAVNIQASDSMNGFNVFVKADVGFLRAVSVDLSNSVLGSSVFTAINCIDLGPSCVTAQNGPGVVQVAMVALGTTTAAPTTGRLFSITYNVTKTGTNIKIGFETGCNNTSTAPNYCDTVVFGGTVLPETVQESTGSWGDFSITFFPTKLTLEKGQFAFDLVTISSLKGFFGSMSLSISISPARGTFSPVTQFVAQSEIFLLPGTLTFETASVITFMGSSPGHYVVTVTGVAGALSHSAQLPVDVRP